MTAMDTTMTHLADPTSGNHRASPAAPPRAPVRVLHVLGSLNRGGVETWLMHMLRGIDRREVAMDFLVHGEGGGAYDEEARRLGADIIVCPNPRRFLAYGASFRRVLRGRGPYDVVHSHVHDFSGYVLSLAAKEGVPVRVAHSHTDRREIPSERALRRRAYRALMGHLIRRHATAGVGASRGAAASLFGAAWREEPRWRVMYYGVDFAPFHAAGDPRRVREDLGVPPGAALVGHVGNLLAVKNHRVLVDMLAALRGRVPDPRLLLVGDGPLKGELAARAERLGVASRVIFAGVRTDVPRLLGAMDVFAFPSLYEGLGLAVVEAQAAGLPVVLSDKVPPDAVVLPGLVRRLPPDAPGEVWADACAAALASRGGVSKAAALAEVEASAFQLGRCVSALKGLYGVTGPGYAG